jgi:hypothetical protein
MDKKKLIEMSKECLQYANELAKDSGVPGIGLVGYFSQHFFDLYLRTRFQEFVDVAGVDVKFLNKIVNDENYSNCLYSALETVRRTHSKIGLAVLALIYKDHWNNPDFLIPAVRAFGEISDNTIMAFVRLYESIPEEKGFLKLSVYKDGEGYFHPNYNEAVELITRNIFVQSSYTGMAENMPIQGRILNHTKEYYRYCKDAIAFVSSR